MKKSALTALLICFFGMSYGQTNIVLVSLPDKDTIDYQYPVFTWFYPSMDDSRQIVKYNYVLTQLNSEQSAQAGVLVNQPLIRINDIQGFQYVYPFDAPELEYGKRYGWQLEKTVNNVITEKSEAWEFTLYKEISVPMKYAILNTDYTAANYEVVGEGFYFKLNSRYKSGTGLKFKVLNDKSEQMDVNFGKDEKQIAELELEKTGEDFYYLKTAGYPSGTYTLIVKDPKGNEYNTRFRIK
ncbi:hypothetical protein [Fluviicola chungangensis]|uniref:Uncharacterized protein n=1 Tax=Fluviicola chungangensis TaxID=2597671 RepID=A0A556MPS0_9FLAO|nr:hypothetical protein [Fluviicola chungangensis]TSJ41865.1 hypothetical protein FO442_12290 [Fluviicola chungangensis]